MIPGLMLGAVETRMYALHVVVYASKLLERQPVL